MLSVVVYPVWFKARIDAVRNQAISPAVPRSYPTAHYIHSSTCTPPLLVAARLVAGVCLPFVCGARLQASNGKFYFQCSCFVGGRPGKYRQAIFCHWVLTRFTATVDISLGDERKKRLRFWIALRDSNFNQAYAFCHSGSAIFKFSSAIELYSSMIAIGPFEYTSIKASRPFRSSMILHIWAPVT